eukprot:m.41629 g.41629  ORF g.41629 m.41629 type:complete len:572 (+) comp10592_c0_seq2:89-1804(+)
MKFSMPPSFFSYSPNLSLQLVISPILYNVVALKTIPIMSLKGLLPKPIHAQFADDDESDGEDVGVSMPTSASTAKIPPYGKRKGWRPKTAADFGDGGAFPELIFAQYPLNMGLKDDKQSKAVVAVQSGADGKAKYDALLKQGHHKDKIIHSTYKSLVPVDIKEDDEKRALPTEDAVQKSMQETAKALGTIVDDRMANLRATHVAKSSSDPTYIRYTPANASAQHNSGAQQRIVRIVEMQVDPLEPPRHRTNKKIPRGPGSPPVPVMHSPERKPTAEEHRDWKIPPAISNWKNHKGFTVPLDKRMAADGRGVQDVTINDNFAKLSEALYIAERESRKEIEVRSKVQAHAAQLEKEKQEQRLREMAEQAREGRIGIRQVDEEDEGQVDEVMEREEIRRDRARERTRQRNIDNASHETRSRLQRDKDRDISERVALGMAAPTAQGGGYDSRLFGQSQGLSSGFGHEDAYNVYDKPMRGAQTTSIYRPTRGKDATGEEEYERIKSTDRFRADKGFSGAEGGSGRVTGPVEFEKKVDEDVFGLGDFLGGGGGGSKGSKSKGKRDASSSERDSKRPK